MTLIIIIYMAHLNGLNQVKPICSMEASTPILGIISLAGVLLTGLSAGAEIDVAEGRGSSRLSGSWLVVKVSPIKSMGRARA